MKKALFLFSVASIALTTLVNTGTAPDVAQEKRVINRMLDSWHAAAAKGDFDAYFGAIASDGIYIGTDATENWEKKQFAEFSKPYFDRGRAWNFKPLERNLFISKDGKTAWFDELLDTWMKVCRGSGVLEKQGDSWKIKHYVLSMTVPNDATQDVLPHKGKYEDALIEKLRTGEVKH